MVITGALFLGGGIAAANRLALQALLDAGYRVDVIALNEASGISTNINANLAYKGMSNNKVKFVLASWYAILRRRRQLIFCDHVNLAVLLSPLSIIRLCRYVVRLNGIEVFPSVLNWEGKLGLHAAYKRTAISDHTRQQVLVQYPSMAIDVCDLSLGPELSQLPREMDLGENPEISLTAVDGSTKLLGERVILHVGRMATTEQYKGQDILIQAMPEILKVIPTAQLVLVGHGDDSRRLLSLARNRTEQVQHSIFMTGFVSDELLEQLYRSCYVFAMPSRGEGFGLVYLEAMRYAKPCLGSHVDSARCIIRDGETGLLVNDPIDTSEVAKKLLILLQQPELAQAMGLAGFKLLSPYYLFSDFKERFISLIEVVR